ANRLLKRQPRDGCVFRRGRWYVRFDGPSGPNGNRRQRVEPTEAKTRAEARLIRAERIRSSQLGDYVEPARLTVETYLDDWLKSRSGDLRPTTLAGYRTAVKCI